MFRKYKKLIILGVFLIVAVGLWNFSKGLVDAGKSFKEIYNEEMGSKGDDIEYPETPIERDNIEAHDGKIIKNQVGNKETKSVQCVLDFFEEYLPDLAMGDMEYELKAIEDGNYCINVGDWYLFVVNQNNISYIYKYTKSVEFTDYEKSMLLGISETSRFVTEGDLYVWEID